MNDSFNQVGKEYGAPLAVVHRGDLQRILLEAANKEGVEIWTNAKVLQVDDTFDARVQLIGGDWIEGDVVVAADGIKSNVRRQMSLATELECSALPTGDAAYRILIPRERMEHDPEALALLESQDAVRWMGPGGHIMAYPIKNNTVYNVVSPLSFSTPRNQPYLPLPRSSYTPKALLPRQSNPGLTPAPNPPCSPSTLTGILSSPAS